MDIDEAIAKYSVPLETPEMNEDEFKASPYIMIRHGLSEFNYRIMVTDHEFGLGSPESRAVETSTELTDPELHAIGVK